MSSELVVVVLSVLALAGAAVAVTAAWRSPRCPTCGVPSEALAGELIHTVPSVVEIVYRCPRCGQIVGRRRFGDWE